MNFLLNDTEIAKKYIHELFNGSTKVAAFCKFNDCSMCTKTSRLYGRVLSYHESDMVQELFNTISKKFTKQLQTIPLS